MDSLQFGIYGACRELHDGKRDDEWCRDFRVLALCFMAAMVEAGDA